jgi:hypothetical protein
LERYRKNQQKMTLKKAATAAAIGALAIGGPALAYKAMPSAAPKTTTTNINYNSYLTIPKASKALLPVSDPACKTYRQWLTQLDKINNTKEFSYVPLDYSQINKMALCATPEQLRKDLAYADRIVYTTLDRLYNLDNPKTRYEITAPLNKDINYLVSTLYQTK